MTIVDTWISILEEIKKNSEHIFLNDDIDVTEILRLNPEYNIPIIEFPEKEKGTDVNVTLI